MKSCCRRLNLIKRKNLCSSDDKEMSENLKTKFYQKIPILFSLNFFKKELNWFSRLSGSRTSTQQVRPIVIWQMSIAIFILRHKYHENFVSWRLKDFTKNYAWKQLIQQQRGREMQHTQNRWNAKKMPELTIMKKFMQ